MNGLRPLSSVKTWSSFFCPRQLREIQAEHKTPPAGGECGLRNGTLVAVATVLDAQLHICANAIGQTISLRFPLSVIIIVTIVIVIV